MRVTQLVLQHSKQIRNDAHSLLQQRNSLIHLQITSHGLIHWLELWFCPHQLWSIEHGSLQMDIDTQNE